MDGERFDALSRRLAQPRTRRGAMKGLLAVALGSGLGRLARADAAGCEPGTKCKAEKSKAERCAGAGLVCENGRFVCPTVANATASFVGGACQYTCAAPPNATASFTDGACAYACLAGFANCDGDILANGCEVATNTDALNCGGCAGAGGSVCAGGKTCQGGTCLCPATAPTECGGQCVDTNSNPSHCGGCAGVSGTACDEFLECCNGSCVDPISYETDSNNCGGCGNVCSPGLTCCGSQCVDTQTDPRHCGGCEQFCLQDQGCGQGVCDYLCGDDGVCPGACYYYCTPCGCDECASGRCGTTNYFCCPGDDPEACLGPDECPPTTQRFVGRRN